MSDVVTDLSELVASVVEPLIENKEELEVTGIDEEDGNILIEIRVNPDDAGKVIDRKSTRLNSSHRT